MNGLHPALAFLHGRLPGAHPVSGDRLVWQVDDCQLEVFVAPPQGKTFFAAGDTALSYSCPARLGDAQKQRLRTVLLELKDSLGHAWVTDANKELPPGGGWTDRAGSGDLSAWRDWVIRSYRASVAASYRTTTRATPYLRALTTTAPAAQGSSESRSP